MFISVIIPTYNSADYISKAVDSVLNQTHQDFEIIIIDDGSTDNTQQVIESYNDNRIIYIKQKNAGPAEARNNGLKRAKGEYVAFLDADDKWVPDKLQLQIEAFKLNPSVSMVYSKLEILNKNNETDEIHSFKNYPNNLELLKYLVFNHIAIVPAVMIKKSYIDQVGFFNPELYTGEDWDFWLRLASKSNFYYIDKTLVLRYRPKTSITYSTDYSVTEQCHKTVMDRFFAIENLDKKILMLKNQAYSFIYFDISSLYFYKDRKNPPMDKVLKALFKSFKYHPFSFFTEARKIKFVFRILVKLTTGY